MPDWFDKAFENLPPEPAEADPPESRQPLDDAPVWLASRRQDAAVASDGIEVRVDDDGATITFMLGGPLLEGYSLWVQSREDAAQSPLAQRLFEVEGVEGIFLYDVYLTLLRRRDTAPDLDALVADALQRLRGHIAAGAPAIAPEYLKSLPGEAEIRARLQDVLDTEINPVIAEHDGRIDIERIEGNTVYVSMSGGCQGCAASALTMQQFVDEAFRRAVPCLGAILDMTDHEAGLDPYYRDLPEQPAS